MKKLAISVFASLAIAAASVSKTLSEEIAPFTETIPIQTLTISDEQFLKGDASGRPTTISGTLKIAQGSGRLPLVILVHGSGGIEENAVVWERLFALLGISTFEIDSFTGRGIVSTVADQSQLGPFEQPTRFHFAINKKTLKALGLIIPAAMLMRADEVIE